MKTRKIFAAFGLPLLVMSIMAAGFLNARKVVEVTIGPVGATVHDLVEDHNLTVRSLERGKTEFWVRAPNRSRYDVNLTTEQVEEILGETTVMADATGGSTEMKVTITVKEESRSSGASSSGGSGW
jgi:hypothetical protein